MKHVSMTVFFLRARLTRTPIQWNPVNTDTKGKCHSVRTYYSGVRIKRALRENVRNTCFIDINTKADSLANQGSIEVCGKAVDRGGGLVWKYHVFTFLWSSETRGFT